MVVIVLLPEDPLLPERRLSKKEDLEMIIGEQRRRGPGGLFVPVYSGISKTVLLVRTGISHKPISTEFSKLHCQFEFRPLII